MTPSWYRRRALSRRRRRVLAQLAAEPALAHAYTIDAGDPGRVIVTLAIRGIGTCELTIEHDRYDAAAMLDLLVEQHGAPIDEPLDEASGFGLGRPLAEPSP